MNETILLNQFAAQMLSRLWAASPHANVKLLRANVDLKDSLEQLSLIEILVNSCFD
jgi:hypothetical protein